jgi:hypothetical protein
MSTSGPWVLARCCFACDKAWQLVRLTTAIRRSHPVVGEGKIQANIVKAIVGRTVVVVVRGFPVDTLVPFADNARRVCRPGQGRTLEAGDMWGKGSPPMWFGAVGRTKHRARTYSPRLADAWRWSPRRAAGRPCWQGQGRAPSQCLPESCPREPPDVLCERSGAVGVSVPGRTEGATRVQAVVLCGQASLVGWVFECANPRRASVRAFSCLYTLPVRIVVRLGVQRDSCHEGQVEGERLSQRRVN